MALVIYFLISFLTSLLAFWSRETGGPRFLLERIIEFTSGAYFPLNILSKAVYEVLLFSPWVFLIYFPLQIYLGKIQKIDDLIKVFAEEIIWIFVLSFLIYVVYKKGLKNIAEKVFR